MLPALHDLGLQDCNGDGVPDTVRARIYVPDDAGPEELAAAANLAARLAFETVSMDLPIGFAVSDYEPREGVSIFVGRAAAAQRNGPGIVALPDLQACENLACSLGADVYAFTENDSSKVLATDFTLADLLKTAREVLLGPEVRSPAIIDLAARIGLESTQLQLPLVRVIHENLERDQAPARSILVGLSNPFVRRLIESNELPLPHSGKGSIAVVGESVIIAGGDPHAEASALRHSALRLPYLWDYGKGHESVSTIESEACNYCPAPAPVPRLVFDETSSLTWELDDARERTESSLFPFVQPGSVVDLEIRISEPIETRTRFAEELRQRLRLAGADPASSVRVLSAHKQGFSWIDEVLAPDLKPAKFIRIRYRELDCERESVDAADRWLHELYPIDEVLARDLGISADQVLFERASSSAPQVYEVIGEDGNGEIVLRAHFDPAFVSRPMFDVFPDYASATVSTGWLRATVDGRVVVDERVKTDYERFWDEYQSTTLPRIRDYIINLHKGHPRVECAPHFDELSVEVHLSEPDYRLGIDEERISTLEALHEDIYFETLLFFEVLGFDTCGKPLKYPGRIIPRVHPSRSGPGRVRIRLTGYDSPFPGVKPLAGCNPRVTAIAVDDRGATAIEVQAGARFSWIVARDRQQSSRRLTARMGGDIARSIVQWDEPIGPEECESIIANLARFPEVRPFPAGRSWLGRTVWAMDVGAENGGVYFSDAKAAATKPCLFITGRQHANEVSSTSHILKLVELLVTEPEHRRLLERVNFVIHPMTNPDGAALVEDLHKRTPGFMLHAGYLGALGVDVTEDQWSDAPKYPESRIRADLWRMCEPDIVLNPHGYPSHEWVQLFAGYTAWVKSKRVRARDWWIPRGWFIPRFDFIEDECFPEHRRAALALRDRVAKAIRETFGAANERMYRRYSKYMRCTLDLHEDVLIQSPACGSKLDPKSFGFMTRHPEITFFEGLSEAPDEVASGDWLKTLAAAGLQFSLAHARFLAELPAAISRTRWSGNGKTIFHITRRRLPG